MAKKTPVEQTNETTVDVVVETSVSSRTKRVNITSDLPTEANGYTLTVNAEVIGTDSVITFSKQTPVVDSFWAQVMVKGIIERFATVVAGSNGDAAVTVERLQKEVEALNAGNYATRGGKGSAKTDFINTVVAMAFVNVYGADVLVNETNFQEIIGNLEALQTADEAYQALSKEDKAAVVAANAKVASGISYFKSALAA